MEEKSMTQIVRDLDAWANANPRYRVCALLAADDLTDTGGTIILGNRDRLVTNLAYAFADRSTGMLSICDKAKKMLDAYRDQRQQMLDAIDSSTPNTTSHADR